jgi:hypothetical protein
LKSDLVDVNGVRHAETTKAVMFSADGVPENGVWLPKAHCEFEPFRGRDGRPYVKATMPEWLAVEKGLV